MRSILAIPSTDGLGVLVANRKSEMDEYKLTLTWRADQDGNGIKTELSRAGQVLQVSFHPTLDLHAAMEAAMTNFFEPLEKRNDL